MNIREILKKNPSEMTEIERRAVGLAYEVDCTGDGISILGGRAEARLLNAAEVLKGRHYHPDFFSGREVGELINTLFSRVQESTTDVGSWLLSAGLEWSNYIIAALGKGQEDTAELLRRYNLIDCSKHGRTSLIQQHRANGVKKEALKDPLGVLLGWRALIISLAEALTLPELLELADLDDIKAELEVNNTYATRASLFLQSIFSERAEIEDARQRLTIPLDALQWIPEPREIEEQAEKLQAITCNAVTESFIYYIERGREQYMQKPTTTDAN